MPDASNILREAASFLGYTESPPGSNRTRFAGEAGHVNGQPWCASFVVAIAKRVGVQLPSSSAYTPTMADVFRRVGRFDKNPRIGDVVFFDFPDSKNRIQHVGFLESFTPGSVTCIEGNTSAAPGGSQDNGGGVFRRTRPRAHVVGFGHPAYAVTGIDPNDERWSSMATREEVKQAVKDALDEYRFSYGAHGQVGELKNADLNDVFGELREDLKLIRRKLGA